MIADEPSPPVRSSAAGARAAPGSHLLGPMIEPHVHVRALDLRGDKRTSEQRIAEAVRTLGLTCIRLRGIIIGTADPSLSEVVKIAAFPEFSGVSEFLTKRQEILKSNYRKNIVILQRSPRALNAVPTATRQ